jgi:RNA polymerase sigma-70 factor (ECF subfamily)
LSDDPKQLVERARQVDTAALRSLLELHGSELWRRMNARIGARWQSMVDADDVMQVTYMEAFLQIGQLTGTDGDGFAGWLGRIAENNLRDAIKELERKKRPHPQRRVRAPVGQDSYVALVEMLGATSATPSRHVARHEANGLIDSALEQMPPDYATAIRLYDLEGKDIADVAAAMGRSTGAVHMLRVRAHDRLRTLLGAPANFFSNAE